MQTTHLGCRQTVIGIDLHFRVRLIKRPACKNLFLQTGLLRGPHVKIRPLKWSACKNTTPSHFFLSSSTIFSLSLLQFFFELLSSLSPSPLLIIYSPLSPGPTMGGGGRSWRRGSGVGPATAGNMERLAARVDPVMTAGDREQSSRKRRAAPTR